jgi:hypothetical protein
LLGEVVRQPRGNVRRWLSTRALSRVRSVPSEALLKIRIRRHRVLAVPALVHGLPA